MKGGIRPMEVTEVKNGVPVISTTPLTHEDLQREYDFLSAECFLKKLCTDGIINENERCKTMQKLRDKISPLYKEIRA